MALEALGLLFAAKNKTEITGGELDIPIDAVVTETHDMTHVVSSVPLEDGSEVSDHVLREPDGLSIEGIVSDAPVEFLGGILKGNFAGGAVGDLLGATRPSQTAFNLLKSAFDQKLLLHVVTRVRTYEDMMPLRLEVPRTRDVGEAIRFKLELRHIRFASSESSFALDSLLDVATSEGKVKDDAQPKKRRGRVGGRKPSTVEEYKAKLKAGLTDPDVGTTGDVTEKGGGSIL